jgi:hypothetical protein
MKLPEIIKADYMPEDCMLIIPARRDGETDDELVKRCLLVKNIGKPKLQEVEDES